MSPQKNGHAAADASSGQVPVAGDAHWLTRERLLILAFLALTVLVFYLCYRLAVPFLSALAWALALAVVARPLHDWLSARVENANATAALSAIAVTVILVVPALFVARQIAVEAGASAQRIKERAESGRWRQVLEQYPSLEPAVRWVEANVDVEQEGVRAIQMVFGDVGSLMSQTVWVALQVLLTLYMLFFFFRDRRKAIAALRSLVPLSNAEAGEVFARVSDTIHATVNGTLMVAVIQGTMGGLMFWLLGLPAPVLWGVVMGLLAVIPYLGTFVIWAPTAAFLALDGDWGRAAILAGWGGIVIALIDNLLYPLLVGKQLRMHTLTAFIGIVGGVGFYGPAGIILGPVTVAVAIALVDFWKRRTAGGKAAETGVQDKQPQAA